MPLIFCFSINFKNYFVFSIFFLQESEIYSLSAMCPRKRLKNCIQFAASKLDDNNESEDRIFDRIRDFLSLMTEDQYSGTFDILSTLLYFYIRAVQ